jgi:osmotically inducible protein OsmC
MEPIYTATAHSTGDGRNGHVTSDDGFVDLDLRIPKEMGGPGGATNPEELFAAGYAASIGIGPLDDGGFGLKADLVVYAPKLDRATAQTLVEAAHKVCPYSNATRGNIEVGLSVIE